MRMRWIPSTVVLSTPSIDRSPNLSHGRRNIDQFSLLYGVLMSAGEVNEFQMARVLLRFNDVGVESPNTFLIFGSSEDYFKKNVIV